MAERRTNRWLAPGVVFGALAILILVQILTSPQNEALQAAPSLTSRSALAYGTRGFYESVARLGWSVQRRDASFREPLDSSAVYVLLGGPTPISRMEVHQVLDAVRRGARLLVIPSRESTIADSLGVRASEFRYSSSPGGPGGVGSKPEEESDKDEARGKSPAPEKEGDITEDVLRPLSDSADVDAIARPSPSRSSGPEASPLLAPLNASELGDVARELGNVRYHLEPLDSAKRARVPFPRDTAAFVTARIKGDTLASVILGMRLGRGRIVAVADPYLFTNYTLRDGDAAVLFIRALEWLDPTRSATVVFDEYHHVQPSVGMFRAVRRALLETPVGRVALQILLAATLVVLALGARPFTPRPRMRIERRSPFEHVGALSRAYEQIAATRVASRRLLQGVRRRHPIGRLTLSDEEYLAALSSRYPESAQHIDRVRRSLDRALEPAEFLALGEAIETIERTVHS